MISVLSSLPSSCDLLDHPADFMIGVGGIGGEHLGLAGVKLLLDEGERIPSRQPGAAISLLTIRPGRELRLGGMTPSRFWLAKICSRSFSQPMSNLPWNLSIHSLVG